MLILPTFVTMKAKLFEPLLQDKALKGKAKVEAIYHLLLGGTVTVDDLISLAVTLKGSEKGTCIEALEMLSRTEPSLCNSACFHFAVDCLGDKAPRVKWEAAKVVGHLAPYFKPQLTKALPALLKNSEDKGTVVRWSAAYALSAILLCRTKLNGDLKPAMKTILEREHNNGVKKIINAALNKLDKAG